jgi:hypothetical protein
MLQNSSDFAAVLILAAPLVATLAGGWKVFTKAGRNGWEVLIPLYDFVVMCEIAGQPAWLVLLLFVPVAGPVLWIVVCMELAKSFGRTSLFGLGLAFAPFVFGPILGFGGSVYLPGVPPAPAATAAWSDLSAGPTEPLPAAPPSRGAHLSLVCGSLSVAAFFVLPLLVTMIDIAINSDNPDPTASSIPGAAFVAIWPGVSFVLVIATMWFGVQGLRQTRRDAPGGPRKMAGRDHAVTGMVLGAANFYLGVLLLLAFAVA